MGHLKNPGKTIVLLVILCIWAVIVTARLFYYTVYAQETYLDYGNKLALRQGVIPAVRGTLFDRNGVRLAWSERQYHLYFASQTKSIDKELKTEIERIVDTIYFEETEDGLLLKRNLSPQQLLELKPLFSRYPKLRKKVQMVRCYIVCDKTREYLGNVVDKNGVCTGVSGIELKYNDELTGTNGIFREMVDRNQKNIPGTFINVQNIISGNDVYLDLSLEEIQNNEK